MFINVDLVNRLYRLFDLQRYSKGPDLKWQLPEVVMATMDLSLVLGTPKLAASGGLDLSGGPGGYVTAFTVPANKRWKLTWLKRDASTADTSIHVYDGTTRVPLTTGSTGASVIFPGTELFLEAGWVLQLLETNNGGDASRQLFIGYTEYDAF